MVASTIRFTCFNLPQTTCRGERAAPEYLLLTLLIAFLTRRVHCVSSIPFQGKFACDHKIQPRQVLDRNADIWRYALDVTGEIDRVLRLEKTTTTTVYRPCGTTRFGAVHALPHFFLMATSTIPFFLHIYVEGRFTSLVVPAIERPHIVLRDFSWDMYVHIR